MLRNLFTNEKISVEWCPDIGKGDILLSRKPLDKLNDLYSFTSYEGNIHVPFVKIRFEENTNFNTTIFSLRSPAQS